MIAIFHADFQGASHGIHNIQPGAFSSGDGMSIVFSHLIAIVKTT
jgi:hypothetical protein